MAFEHHENQFQEFLTYLHLLSDAGWTGRFFVRMEDGRLTRGTMAYLNDKVALLTHGVETPQGGTDG